MNTHIDLAKKDTVSLTVDDLWVYISRDCYGGILGISVYRRFGTDEEREWPLKSLAVATKQRSESDEEPDE